MLKSLPYHIKGYSTAALIMLHPLGFSKPTLEKRSAWKQCLSAINCSASYAHTP